MRPYIKVARELKIARLDSKRTFRDLEIDIETNKGSYRHWRDPHDGSAGKTLMLFPYGYIRKTKGMDGEAIDCFIGPNENAPNVYVVLTNRPPDFKREDEQKCMLGFSTADEAKRAFQAHYQKEGFFREMRTFPYETFKEKVYTSTKLAAILEAVYARRDYPNYPALSASR